MMVPMSLRPVHARAGHRRGLDGRATTCGSSTDAYYLEIIGADARARPRRSRCSDLVIGYPLAYFLARSTSRWRSWLTLLVIFPLLLNLVVRTFGWIALLANRGLVNNG